MGVLLTDSANAQSGTVAIIKTTKKMQIAFLKNLFMLFLLSACQAQ